jgi:hypothetical protein
MRETVWSTNEPCPACDAGLVRVDDGCALQRTECRSCGYVVPWVTEDGTEVGQW